MSSFRIPELFISDHDLLEKRGSAGQCPIVAATIGEILAANIAFVIPMQNLTQLTIRQ